MHGLEGAEFTGALVEQDPRQDLVPRQFGDRGQGQFRLAGPPGDQDPGGQVAAGVPGLDVQVRIDLAAAGQGDAAPGQAEDPAQETELAADHRELAVDRRSAAVAAHAKGAAPFRFEPQTADRDPLRQVDPEVQRYGGTARRAGLLDRRRLADGGVIDLHDLQIDDVRREAAGDPHLHRRDGQRAGEFDPVGAAGDGQRTVLDGAQVVAARRDEVLQGQIEGKGKATFHRDGETAGPGQASLGAVARFQPGQRRGLAFEHQRQGQIVQHRAAFQGLVARAFEGQSAAQARIAEAAAGAQGQPGRAAGDRVADRGQGRQLPEIALPLEFARDRGVRIQARREAVGIEPQGQVGGKRRRLSGETGHRQIQAQAPGAPFGGQFGVQRRHAGGVRDGQVPDGDLGRPLGIVRTARQPQGALGGAVRRQVGRQSGQQFERQAADRHLGVERLLGEAGLAPHPGRPQREVEVVQAGGAVAPTQLQTGPHRQGPLQDPAIQGGQAQGQTLVGPGHAPLGVQVEVRDRLSRRRQREIKAFQAAMAANPQGLEGGGPGRESGQGEVEPVGPQARDVGGFQR